MKTTEAKPDLDAITHAMNSAYSAGYTRGFMKATYAYLCVVVFTAVLAYLF